MMKKSILVIIFSALYSAQVFADQIDMATMLFSQEIFELEFQTAEKVKVVCQIEKDIINCKDASLLPVTNTLYKYYGYERLAIILPVVNGKANGVARIYDRKGKLNSELSYKNGMLDGSCKTYIEGKLANITVYDRGKEVSFKKYKANNKLEYEMYYLDGKLEGPTRQYYDNGQLEEEILYKGGVAEGVAHWFYQNEQLRLMIPYVAGKANGLCRLYYADGTIMGESMYKDGRPHGLTRLYNKKGILEQETVYENGQMHGLSIGYYENGQVKSKIEYNAGKSWRSQFYNEYGEDITEIVLKRAAKWSDKYGQSILEMPESFDMRSILLDLKGKKA